MNNIIIKLDFIITLYDVFEICSSVRNVGIKADIAKVVLVRLSDDTETTAVNNDLLISVVVEVDKSISLVFTREPGVISVID